MAIVDITIIPIGTETTSVSDYVAEIQKVLMKYKEDKGIEFQLTPMSTIIEGDLPVLFDTVQALHEAVFNKGIMRIATNIRIDDRRDKKSNMKSKLESVYNKM
ncbi:MTH1187 family thiamine-binding protein [Peribacillus acanthi]|uniref:MTH1187 family thiamine-binding protein n=1 Tax=Peribacillus acanthi TaxID=2171554 RepID=UPI000D3E121A|nr:MTH1187 family thiamine-binding protein [Peribacillus acanthi]